MIRFLIIYSHLIWASVALHSTCSTIPIKSHTASYTNQKTHNPKAKSNRPFIFSPITTAPKEQQPTSKTPQKTKYTAPHLLTTISFLLVVIFQSLGLSNFSQTQKTHQTPHQKSKTDIIFQPTEVPNRTWFMSMLKRAEHRWHARALHLPLIPPNYRILCMNTEHPQKVVRPRHHQEHALPENSRFTGDWPSSPPASTTLKLNGRALCFLLVDDRKRLHEAHHATLKISALTKACLDMVTLLLTA